MRWLAIPLCVVLVCTGCGGEMRTRVPVDSEGIVKWGDNLYTFIAVDETHTKIYRTPAYSVEGCDAMEVAERVTVDASVANWGEAWGFLGAGGKIYLWDGARRVITFDIAAMAVEATDDYEFDIAAIACDADAYYLGQSGTISPNVPLHVHRIPLTGAATEYEGQVANENCQFYHEHFVDYIYCAAGKVYLSCGSNPAGSSPFTDRHLTEIDPSTMAYACRSNLNFASGPSDQHGITDLVTDGTSVYALLFGYYLYKYTVGTLGDYSYRVNVGAVGYRPDGLMYYSAHVYRSVGGTVYVYECSDLSGTSNESDETLYGAVCDGTWIWQDWLRWGYRSLTRTEFPPVAESENLPLFFWSGEDVVVYSFPWVGRFQLSRVI